MSEANSKLFRDDPAAYYTELGAEAERERIINLIRDTYIDMELQELGSMVWTEDIVDLIERDTK